MSKYKPGDVVIVATGQSGCVWTTENGEIAVILLNSDIWYGPEHDVRVPSSDEELKTCPLNIDKWTK